MPEQRSSLFISNAVRLASTGGGGGNSAAYTNFIARTSGLDGTHLTAYAGLLNGLTTDGLFNSDGTSSFFDALYVFATQDSVTSKLNLVSSSFPVTTPGGSAFTADRGWISDGGTNTMTTTLNASTATLYTQDSAHMSGWNTNGVNGATALIDNSGATAGVNMFCTFNGDGLFYSRVNDLVESSGYSVAAIAGHYIGNRSSSTAIQGYKNGSSAGSAVSTSKAPPNVTFNFCNNDSTIQIGGASFGASMSSTNAGNFYTRLRTYMTAVGAP